MIKMYSIKKQSISVGFLLSGSNLNAEGPRTVLMKDYPQNDQKKIKETYSLSVEEVQFSNYSQKNNPWDK